MEAIPGGSFPEKRFEIIAVYIINTTIIIIIIIIIVYNNRSKEPFIFWVE